MKYAWSVVGVLLLFGNAFAFDLFGDRASPGFSDNGDTAVPFAVTAGSNSAVAVYTKRNTGTDRRLRLCNPTAAYLYVSTFSAATANSPRTLVPKGVCEDLPTNMTLYAIYEAAASSASVVGFAQYQARD